MDLSLVFCLVVAAEFIVLRYTGVLLEFCSDDLKPILQSRPELMESLSHAAIKAQQFVAMFDKAAIQPIPIEQRDLLSRIKTYFHLEL